MKMKVSDASILYDYKNGWWLNALLKDKASAEHAKKLIDALFGKMMSLELGEWREKRSLDSNGYAWVLIDKIAQATGLTKKDVYRNTVREVAGSSDMLTLKKEAAERFIQKWSRKGSGTTGGWIAEVHSETRTPGFVNVIAYYGSSSYDTSEMSRFIDLLIDDCKEYGIEHLPPEEIERMLGAWQVAEQKHATSLSA